MKPARPGLERKFFLNPFRIVHTASLRQFETSHNSSVVSGLPDGLRP
jgi:hypothetical protein